MITETGGGWIWFFSEEKCDYEIIGKYLFFCDDKNKLIKIAENEITNYHFHEAKVPEYLKEGLKEYVLCLYYKDNSRNNELKKRNEEEYKVKFRNWKTDEATLKGQYSKEFLSKLSKSDRNWYTKEK